MPLSADLNEQTLTRLIEEYLELCYRTHSAPRASEFAESLQRTAKTVRRCVRHTYGIPLGSLLRQKRLEKVASLLRTTDLTVEAIIRETAWGDRRALFRTFRAAFRASPLEYRLLTRTHDRTPE
jgi:transcriptional regulator GlxA family with amidase domain